MQCISYFHQLPLFFPFTILVSIHPPFHSPHFFHYLFISNFIPKYLYNSKKHNHSIFHNSFFVTLFEFYRLWYHIRWYDDSSKDQLIMKEITDLSTTHMHTLPRKKWIIWNQKLKTLNCFFRNEKCPNMWGSHMKTKQCLDGNVGMCLALGFTWGLAFLCPHIIITIISSTFLFVFVFIFLFQDRKRE